MSVPKRFSILRFFGSLLKVLAWIVLVLSIVGAVIAAIFGSSLSTMLSGQSVVDPTLLSTGGGFVAGIITLIMGLFYFVLLYAVGENVHLTLAMEENTRLTAALLLRMHQESQVEQPAAYGAGGFASEPFDS